MSSVLCQAIKRIDSNGRIPLQACLLSYILFYNGCTFVVFALTFYNEGDDIC